MWHLLRFRAAWTTPKSGSGDPIPPGRYQWRFWDGTQWTDRVSSHGDRTVDPPGAPPIPLPLAQPVPSPDRSRPVVATQPAPRREDTVWDTLSFSRVVGAFTLMLGATRVDPFGNENKVKFGDVHGSGLLVFFAIVMIFFSFALMRSWPPRAIAWVATVLAAWSFLLALRVRSDPSTDEIHDLNVPLSSALNLVLLGAALCLIGSLVCLRADGPVFGKRRDKLVR